MLHSETAERHPLDVSTQVDVAVDINAQIAGDSGGANALSANADRIHEDGGDDYWRTKAPWFLMHAAENYLNASRMSLRSNRLRVEASFDQLPIHEI